MENHVAARSYNVLSICAGVGGLELGVCIARSDARAVCYLEREIPAAAVLAARIKDGSLHDAPIWSDLTTFDPEPWRGLVDCITSGDPCQPNSVAGKGLGKDDDRWLLDHIMRIVEVVRPARFFRENVVGNAVGQIEYLVPALESMGRRVAAGIFSAGEDAQASHRRERLFIMADLPNVGHEWSGRARAGRSGDPDRSHALMVGHESERRGEARGDGERSEERVGERGALGDTECRVVRTRGHKGHDGSSRETQGEARKRERLRSDDRTASGDLADHDRSGPTSVSRDASEMRGLPEAKREPEHGSSVSVGSDRPMGDPLRSGNGRFALKSRRPAIVGEIADGAGGGFVSSLADSSREGSQGQRKRDGQGGREVSHGHAGLSNGTGLPLFAPGPSDPRWPAIISTAPHLAPAVSDFNEAEDAYLREIEGMGSACGAQEIESLVRRVDARLAGRVDRLRECGNGVSSLAAAVAWDTLEAKLYS